MKSRERVALALEHREPDRVPLDLGGSNVSGMHVSAVYALRQALRLDRPGAPVKVIEPYQMLGEIAPDLMEALGVDVAVLRSRTTKFGFDNEGWKPWALFDGTPVLVPKGFNTEPDANGSIPMYPQGDSSAPPSGIMPKGGHFFDAIIRQPPLEKGKLKPEDNFEEFTPISGEELEYFGAEAHRLYAGTDCAVFANFGGSSFGDISNIPGVGLKHPRGIRDVKEWYLSLITRPDHVRRIFERQCEVALANVEKVRGSMGDRISVIFVSGTDFGTQKGPIMSQTTYRRLYQPFHKRINDWIHEHTPWKTFIHSCGSVEALIGDFIEAGFDVLNPVQTSAYNMDPHRLKEKYGGKVAFWGGGVDTQRTLPFGTPDDVRREVLERIRIFGRGGGFVFNTVHNVQPGVPVANLLAMYEAFREHGTYPLK
jgi:hypothetical protein